MLRLALITTVFSLILAPFDTLAQSRSEAKRLPLRQTCSISLTNIPTEFEAVDLAGQPQVVLALRHKRLGFPTINAIFQSSPYPSSGLAQAEAISKSYAQFGLAVSEISELPGTLEGPLPHIVSYEEGGIEMVAIVQYLECREGHIVLTLVEAAPEREQAIATWNSIRPDMSGVGVLTSGTLTSQNSTEDHAEDARSTVMAIATILFACFTALAFSWLLYRALRMPPSNNRKPSPPPTQAED